MKKLTSPTYGVFNDQGIFIYATRSEGSSIKTAKELAKKAGESYITIGTHRGRGKKAAVKRLKCVLRFGKNGSVKCPSRDGKKCKKLARVRCHPTRSIPRVVSFGKKRRKKR